jgi:hypothetical protein
MSIQQHAGYQQYNAPKPQGDIDLVSEIVNLLQEAGLNDRVNIFLNHKYVAEAKNKYSEVQRYLLNRYFSTQLLLVPVSSDEERFCLIPNGSVQEWLTLFKLKIMPFLIGNNLPREI